jgi:hypothetical protein
MSYILDALKKLEQEKTRKSRTTGKINISGELFANERIRSAEVRHWKTVVYVSVAVLTTLFATWLFLKVSGKSNHSTTVASASRPSSSTNNPVPAPAPATPITPPIVTPSVLQLPAVVATPPVVAVVPVQPVVSIPSVTDQEDEDEARHRRRLASRANVSKPRESVGSTPIQAPVDIKVSGIAWQDEHRARRAVVNGFLLREGSVVSGAKITEIMQDRVKFALSGAVFEVTLISAGSAAAGK